jgi:hypothetical protein
MYCPQSNESKPTLQRIISPPMTTLLGASSMLVLALLALNFEDRGDMLLRKLD